MRVFLFGLVAAWLSLAGAGCAAPPLVAYGRLPATELVSLSPSGSAYALVATVGDARRLGVVSRAGKLLFQSDIGRVKVEDLSWGGGDDFLIVRHSATVRMDEGFTVDKAELDGAIVVDLKASKFHYVFGDGQRRVANTVAGFYGVARVGGRWFGYFGAYPYVTANQDLQAVNGLIYADLYRVDLTTNAFDMVAKGHPDLTDWLITAEGKVAARSLYSERGQAWRVLRGGAGTDALLQGRDPLGAPSFLGFGRAADTLLLKRSAYEPPTVAPLAGGSPHPDPDLGVGAYPLADPTRALDRREPGPWARRAVLRPYQGGAPARGVQGFPQCDTPPDLV